MARWHRERRKDNDGRGLDVYYKDDFEISLNVNKGNEVSTGIEDRNGHHWWFEVVRIAIGKVEFVGEAPTLAGAKRLAR